jgi:hypothetical protein
LLSSAAVPHMRGRAGYGCVIQKITASPFSSESPPK